MSATTNLIIAAVLFFFAWFGGRWWLENTLSGRRFKRKMGHNTRVRGGAHKGSAAVAGGGASHADGRNG